MFNLFMVPLVIFLAYVLITRSKYQNRKGAGAFFFEDDKMVLNSALPYPISISDIDHVELKYNSWELKQTMSYNLFIKVVLYFIGVMARRSWLIRQIWRLLWTPGAYVAC